MKLPLNSIKEFTECNLELENILSTLSRKIGEVEGYTNLSDMYKDIYIAEIVEKKDHPDADKLAIYDINIGEKENIQVVAGDKSLSIGNKVAYIKPGNIVPSTYGTSEEFKIKAVKMRGVLSNGMLCSEKELNIGADHTKVLVLDDNAVVGTLFANYFELNDTVIDIENKALTNRGDLFGIIGLARELSASQGLPFKSPDWYSIESTPKEIDKDTLPVTLSNDVSNLCPRYMCVSMENISINQSPVWLKSLLIRAGIKPINNVVDITNYLAIITGQPLHAFDYDKLVKNDPNSKGEAHINVRLARDGERIHTLDGSLVELSNNNLVIADSTNPIAIGGVIGGMDTQIDETTTRVVIESASFNRFSIRKTSMELGIFTEAVTRYTKGQDPNYCLPILLKAISLIEDLAQARMSSNILDIYPQPVLQKNVSFSVNKLNTHLGTTLSKEEIENILHNIEYEIVGDSDDIEYITVKPPLFRTDIYIPEDIYEDIGRIYGYENIISRLPQRDIKASNVNSNVRLKSKIRDILSNSGCNELDTYSFTSSQIIKNSNQDPNSAYHIKNALSPDLSFMRTSLLTSILEKTQSNISRNINTFCLYEFNISHQKEYIDNFQLPKEDWHLSLIFTTKESILDGNPYYQVKRYFEKITQGLSIENLKYELLAESSEMSLPIWIKNIIPSFNPNSSAYIVYEKEGKSTILGVMGDIDSEVKTNFKLPKYTAAIEVNLAELEKITNTVKKYSEGSKYPSISHDICFTVPQDIKYIQIEDTVLKNINTKDRRGVVECLDIYQKEEGVKNITVRVTIEHRDKTLTDKEFEKIEKQIIERVKTLSK